MTPREEPEKAALEERTMKSKMVKALFSLAILSLLTAPAQAQEIFDAVKGRDLAKVMALIAKDPSLVNAKDQAGNSPLHHAAITGSAAIAESLLSAGADINASNAQQNTALIESIVNGNDDVTILLIGKGADIRRRNFSGSTALHAAALRDRTKVAALLIDRGLEVDGRDAAGFTPLNVLARVTNNVDMARLLIAKGADVNAKDNRNTTPLNNAGIYGHLDIINLLLDHGADFEAAGELAGHMIDRAAELGSERLFDVVARKFGDSVFQDGSRNKRLMSSALGGGSIGIVQRLLARNIPLSFDPDRGGWTPLHHAAGVNKRATVEFMVEKGADINARTNDGRSPYNIAEENGHKDMAGLILKLGGDPAPQAFPILKGPYMGQAPPGDTLVLFAPGIIVIDHSSITTSPDGTEMAWGTGTSVMMSRVKAGRWTKPEYAPFSGKSDISFYDDVPFFSPDGKRLFFTSRRPLTSSTDRKENIWFVERTDGGWSDPKPVGDEVNGMALHWQISVSKSGTLYFAGRRDDELGSGDIYRARIVNGRYARPENLGPVINSKDGETQPFIAPDESYLLFSRVVERRPVPYISYRSKEGSWLPPLSLEKYIGKVGCLIVSPDGKYVFTQNSLWVSAGFIEGLKPKF
jgi:ankyrin repeat protein